MKVDKRSCSILTDDQEVGPVVCADAEGDGSCISGGEGPQCQTPFSKAVEKGQEGRVGQQNEYS